MALLNDAMPHSMQRRTLWERKCFGWETASTLILTSANVGVSSWSRDNPEVGKSEPLHIAGEDVEASLEVPQQVKHTVTI